jgi:MtN3 and saliva related transmembrane protein
MNFVIIGYLAAFFTAVSFLPQAIKTIKTREVAGLSVITYLFLFFGSLSWLVYGYYLKDLPILTTNTLTTISTFIILFLIFKERKNTYN